MTQSTRLAMINGAAMFEMFWRRTCVAAALTWSTITPGSASEVVFTRTFATTSLTQTLTQGVADAAGTTPELRVSFREIETIATFAGLPLSIDPSDVLSVTITPFLTLTNSLGTSTPGSLFQPSARFVGDFEFVAEALNSPINSGPVRGSYEAIEDEAISVFCSNVAGNCDFTRNDTRSVFGDSQTLDLLAFLNADGLRFIFDSSFRLECAQAAINCTASNIATLEGGVEVRITLADAIPEAPTWAMMLLGFLGIGSMAYRRKSKPVLVTA